MFSRKDNPLLLFMFALLMAHFIVDKKLNNLVLITVDY